MQSNDDQKGAYDIEGEEQRVQADKSPPQDQIHYHYMSLALKLASLGRGTVSPNPLVGCVIVRDHQIVGRGYHQYAGGPHAEVYALLEAEEKASGGTAYITLEPCAHYGRTPPCANALIAARISKVYVACLDPNPLVAGRGIQLLQNAGIEVEVGLCQAEASKLNEIFFHYIIHKTPFVFAKWAMSLDGKTITHQDDSREISSRETSKFTHQLRHDVDAIVIGANTARVDDPRLTVRLAACHASESSHPGAEDENNTKQKKQPLRIIVSSDGNLPEHLQILSGELPGKTIIATTEIAATETKTLAATLRKNVEIMVLPKNSKGLVDLPSLLTELGKREISSVLVEGGMTLHENFIQENLIQKIFVYVSPVIIGALERKQAVKILSTMQMMSDSIYEVKYV